MSVPDYEIQHSFHWIRRVNFILGVFTKIHNGGVGKPLLSFSSLSQLCTRVNRHPPRTNRGFRWMIHSVECVVRPKIYYLQNETTYPTGSRWRIRRPPKFPSETGPKSFRRWSECRSEISSDPEKMEIGCCCCCRCCCCCCCCCCGCGCGCGCCCNALEEHGEARVAGNLKCVNWKFQPTHLESCHLTQATNTLQTPLNG